MAKGRPASKTASKTASKPALKPDVATQILEAALARAENEGWGNLRLRDLAQDLGLSLAEIQAQYRDLDAIADAWFRRGWAAMLAPPPEAFDALPAQERLRILLLRWFDALAPHRRVTGQMLSAKLYPSHPHHWVPMVFNLSRTIHWLRDAAGLDAGGRRRQLEEVGLTALFLASLRDWLRDESPDQARSRDRLARRLAASDRLMVRLYGPASSPKGPSK